MSEDAPDSQQYEDSGAQWFFLHAVNQRDVQDKLVSESWTHAATYKLWAAGELVYTPHWVCKP